MHKIRILFVLLLAIPAAGLEAQQTLAIAGGEATGTGGTVSYTIGQVWYTTLDGDDISVFQGVQQPLEVLEITGIHSLPGITLDALLYPNPVEEIIHLRVENYSINGLSYQLFNMKGELLDSKDIESEITQIPMSGYGAASYLIKISRNTDEIKAFKIIKK